VITINQVLLLRDPRYSEELGEALWAAFREVENFYNDGEQRAVFRRYYFSETIPESIQKRETGEAVSAVQKMREFFTGSGNRPVGEVSSEVTTRILQNDSKWATTAGPYVRSFDAGKIARLAWELTHAGSEESWSREGTMQVVVTDLVLVPPEGWRYIIWSRDVISIAPTDPKFWNMKEANRKSILKHRVRTACLSVTGQLIGLKRCDNERCFLCKNVDSVTRLDDMVVLGPEHNIGALSQKGFEIFAIIPGKVQDIKDNPMSDTELG
jgi:hypothetical protein